MICEIILVIIKPPDKNKTKQGSMDWDIDGWIKKKSRIKINIYVGLVDRGDL